MDAAVRHHSGAAGHGFVEDFARPVPADAVGSPWTAHAEQWRFIGPPLRPHKDDVAVAQREVDRLAGARSSYVLLLGVTRELAGLRWPPGVTLIAADASSAMLRHEWRPPDDCASLALRCQWQTLPMAGGSIALALADGSLSALPDIESIRQVIARVADVLRPDGRFALRAYLRPEKAESPWQVVDELLGGRISSMHAAKWRLAMALHGTLESGVALDLVWRTFRQSFPDTRALSERTGWPIESIDTIDVYRGVLARYVFPTLHELRDLLAARFTELACEFPTYELGERCPTLILRPR